MRKLSLRFPLRVPPQHNMRDVIAQLHAEMGALKKYSFLIGATDPFIVVPGAFSWKRSG